MTLPRNLGWILVRERNLGEILCFRAEPERSLVKRARFLVEQEYVPVEPERFRLNILGFPLDLKANPGKTEILPPGPERFPPSAVSWPEEAQNN